MFEFNLEASTSTTLRLLTHFDSFELFSLIDSDRPHLGKYQAWVEQLQTVEDTDNYVTNCLMQLVTGTGFVTGICTYGKLVGTIGFQPIDFKKMRVDIGYWIHTDFEGKGFVTKATLAMISIAFNRYRLESVSITVDPDNTRSANIPKRLGFVIEADDKLTPNMVRYVLSREAWLDPRFDPESIKKRTG